jgi:hypothetical protein
MVLHQLMFNKITLNMRRFLFELNSKAQSIKKQTYQIVFCQNLSKF